MSETFSVWFLIGAALVFWMQAGFAMVEAGFTRSKNTSGFRYFNDRSSSSVLILEMPSLPAIGA